MTVLDKLISKAHEDEQRELNNPEALRKEVKKGFEANRYAAEYMDELLAIIEPLQELLPNLKEYKEWDAYRPPAGAPPATNPRYDLLRTKSPSFVFIAMARQTDEECGDYLPQLTDDEYMDLLDTTEGLAEYWEKRDAATAYELARAVIFTTVLQDEAIRTRAFSCARAMVSGLVDNALMLGDWRKEA